MATMVTGALGYTGRHIAAELARRNHQVIGYNRDYCETEAANITHVQGELYDIPRIVGTIRKHSIDRIIHTAAMSHPDLSIDLPITTVTANIDGTVLLLEAAKLAGVKKLVNFSSETVYGHIEGRVTEESPLRPTTPYGVTKVAVELFGRVYNELYDMNVVSLRIAEVYGPGNKMPQIHRDIIKTVLKGETFSLANGADHRFQFIHVDDVANAVILAAEAGKTAGHVFNISGGGYWTMRDAVDLIRKFIPEARIEIGEGFCHLDRQGQWDISAAERELGYKPTVSLENGTKQYVEWLRKNAN